MAINIRSPVVCVCLSVCINTYNTVKLILSTQAALWVLSPSKPLILESVLLDSPAPVGKLDPVNKSSGWIHVGPERQTVSDKVLELDTFRSESVLQGASVKSLRCSALKGVEILQASDQDTCSLTIKCFSSCSTEGGPRLAVNWEVLGGMVGRFPR